MDRVPHLPTRIRTLGRTEYEPVWRAMRAFTDSRTPETADEVWVTEHPPVYTLGIAGRREHLLRDTVIPVIGSDRGGQITYHGPGQVVVYLLLDLRRRGLGVRRMVRGIESAVIELLASFGIAAVTREGAPGVYAGAAGEHGKIAALGLRIRNGCSYHGIALNVAMDLSPFLDIDPCGYPGLSVTQMSSLGVDADLAIVGRRLAAELVRSLGLHVPAVGPDGLERIERSDPRKVQTMTC